MRRVLYILAIGAAAACGGGGEQFEDAAAGSDGAGPDMAGGVIPDPGTEVGGEWTDVEPNDTPSQATPVGVLNGPAWVGFVEPFTEIASTTDVDYFVFKTADAASLANDYISLCWGGGVNLLDAHLYEVVDQHQGTEVVTATTTNTSCETVIDFGQGPTILAADTVYLLELRAAPGLPAAGLPIGYSA